MADWLLLRLPRVPDEPASWLVVDARGTPASDCTRAPVAVVARALLDEWLATLRSSGIEPEAIHAESDLLPGNPAHAVVLLEEDAVFVRAPGAAPVTLPADALAEALEI